LTIYKDKERAEKDFQECQKHYMEFNDSYSSDKCYFYIFNAVKNIMLSLIKPGQRIQDIDDKATDATLDIFKKMKEGTNIKKLSSFVYLYARGRLFDRKEQRRNSNEVLFSDINLDDNGEKELK